MKLPFKVDLADRGGGRRFVTGITDRRARFLCEVNGERHAGATDLGADVSEAGEGLAPVAAVLDAFLHTINRPGYCRWVQARSPEQISDRLKVEFRAIPYTQRLAEAVASVGSRSDFYDDAMAEALKSSLEAECIRNPEMRSKDGWKNVTHVEMAVAEYVDWFSHRRLRHEPGPVPPVELKANNWAQIRPEYYPQTPVPNGAGST